MMKTIGNRSHAVRSYKLEDRSDVTSILQDPRQVLSPLLHVRRSRAELMHMGKRLLLPRCVKKLSILCYSMRRVFS